jgi:mannose-P-dolichol utilization defect protein 1
MESLERTLRTVLSPITHNLPKPIQEVATTLLGDSCYRSLVHNLTISDSTCMKLAFSKVLGLAIVGASSVVKVPQIIKLINSGSADGISLIGYLLETASFMISLVYNVRNQFPFSSYGETALILVQNVAICFLVLEYSGKGNMGSMMIAALAGAGFLLFNSDIVKPELLQYLQMGAGIVGVASKLPQIFAIFREGGTGQLSAFTVSRARTSSLRNIEENTQANQTFSIQTGFQLPIRLDCENLHNHARGPRQSHPLRLHRRLRAEPRPGPANVCLLERPREQEHNRAQTHTRRQARDQRAG